MDLVARMIECPPVVRHPGDPAIAVFRHNWWVTDEELLARVQEMRERGSTPKGIAKVLGLRPSEVAPLIRKAAALQTPADPADRALLGCWINQGWSAGLGLDDVPEWAAADPIRALDHSTAGMAQILIARQDRASRATVCGFLVDVHCLGVKNTTELMHMGAGSIDDYRRTYFSAFDGAPLAVSLELAQHVVHGAVAYARGLGFEPHAGFATTAPYLGTPSGDTPIVFGREGKPFYMAGPHDNPSAIVRTLEASVGAGNYDFFAPTQAW